MSQACPPLRIGFIHPELGLGGAERLVVEAALHLQNAGHRVSIFTAHHNRARCFQETCDGTLDVRVYGDFLPLHVGQRLRAPCTIARMAYLACAITLRGDRFDVIFCDLVPHAMPLLRLFSRARLVFYCHFPDQLLTPQRRFLYRLYRAPIDRLEEITTGMADRVLVNSHFTAAAFRQTFLRLRTVTPEVLYPGIDVARYARLDAEHSRTPDNTTPAGTGKTTLLSISRYERQKNVALAIQALALLRARLSPEAFARLQLVVAGGYDKRLREHRETLRDLQLRVHRLRLGAHVVFVRSPTDTARLALLSRCLCVVYTPENEHFGLVPLEAMAAGRPVVAVRSGGPLETVRHEATGLLCAPTPEAFAEALARLITNPAEARRLGQEGRAHVLQHFSHSAFGNRLDTMMRNLVEPPQ